MDGGGDKSATSGCRYSKSPIHVVVAVSITIIIIIPSQCTNSPIPSSLSLSRHVNTYIFIMPGWLLGLNLYLPFNLWGQIDSSYLPVTRQRTPSGIHPLYILSQRIVDNKYEVMYNVDQESKCA